MRVVSIAPGDFGGRVRFPGDEFDMPDGSTGTWFRPVDDLPPAAKHKSGHTPPDLTKAQAAEVKAERAKARHGVGTGEGHGDMT